MKIDTRIRELIAVGASVTANCQPCFQYHAATALESGADDREVATAIAVAKAVKKGATAKMDDFARVLERGRQQAIRDQTVATAAGVEEEDHAAQRVPA